MPPSKIFRVISYLKSLWMVKRLATGQDVVGTDVHVKLGGMTENP
jgi:hypothetical protein